MRSWNQKWWDCDVMRFSDTDFFHNYNFKTLHEIVSGYFWSKTLTHVSEQKSEKGDVDIEKLLDTYPI